MVQRLCLLLGLRIPRIPTSVGEYRRAPSSTRVASILEVIRGEERQPRARCVHGGVGRECICGESHLRGPSNASSRRRRGGL